MPEITVLNTADFPPLLREIADPPKKLYVRGKLPSTDWKWLAVVGSRAMTSYGRQACAHLISGLRGYPVVIVSGLAFGVDAAAHKAALEAGLPTVAVPGSGLDWSVLYPRANVSLAREIISSGGGSASGGKRELRDDVGHIILVDKLPAPCRRGDGDDGQAFLQHRLQAETLHDDAPPRAGDGGRAHDVYFGNALPAEAFCGGGFGHLRSHIALAKAVFHHSFFYAVEIFIFAERFALYEMVFKRVLGKCAVGGGGREVDELLHAWRIKGKVKDIFRTCDVPEPLRPLLSIHLAYLPRTVDDDRGRMRADGFFPRIPRGVFL